MKGFGRVLALVTVFLAAAAVVIFAWAPPAAAPAAAPAAGEGSLLLTDVLWYVVAGAGIFSAAVTAFHRNIIYAGFALLGSFGTVAALFVYLSADFLAVAQVAVYIGGILVLILFAVMLTQQIHQVESSNPSIGLPWAVALGLVLTGLLVFVAVAGPWQVTEPGPLASTFLVLGHALLQEYLLPFEVASVLLLAVLIGAVIIVRKEVRPDAS